MTNICDEINMQISVILAHPDPARFNHTIVKTAVEALKSNGHKVFFHDLYKEKFDPLICGLRKVHRRTFHVIVTDTERQRKNWLDTVTKDIDMIFPKQ